VYLAEEFVAIRTLVNVVQDGMLTEWRYLDDWIGASGERPGRRIQGRNGGAGLQMFGFLLMERQRNANQEIGGWRWRLCNQSVVFKHSNSYEPECCLQAQQLV